MPIHDVYLKVQMPAHAALPLGRHDSAMHASDFCLGTMLQTHLMVLSHCCQIDWIAGTLSQGCIVLSIVLLLFMVCFSWFAERVTVIVPEAQAAMTSRKLLEESQPEPGSSAFFL